MSFSALAWSGFAGYFKILERIHYTRPIRWNAGKHCLEVNPSPQKLLWTIGALCSFIVGIAVPVYVALEQVLVNKMKLTIVQHGVPLIVFFFASMHALPIFLHTLFVSKSDLVHGFNNIVQLENHLLGKD
jgi:membrane protease YdiL (CAAX protease family)